MDPVDLMIIDAAGSPRERGRAHGEQACDLIATGLEQWRAELAASGRDADELWKGLSRVSGFRDAAARWAPDLLEEVEGIAEGVGLRPVHEGGQRLDALGVGHGQTPSTSTPMLRAVPLTI